MGNIQAATTTTTSVTNLIKSYYERMLLETLDPSTRFYQFGVKKPLPKGEGTSVIWNRATPLGLGMQLSIGTPTSTANALSTQTVSAVIAQYGGFTSLSDIVDMTAITSVMDMAVARLGQQAAETRERVIQNAIIRHASTTNSSAHSFGKTSASGTIENWGQTSVCADTVSSTNVISVSDVRQMVYALKRLNVAPYEGNDFVSIINTEQAEDLVGDSSWINFHQYAAPGQTNLYTGEIGKIYGCRFVETNLGPVSVGSNAGGTASSLAYGAVVFGSGFFGVTELDGGIKMQGPVTGASKSDPLNQTTTIGWKMNFTSKILNTSAGLVLWTGSGDTSAAYAESAGSGLRHEDPTAY